ncbi:MAG: cysteine hydrolase family protein [Planctomycetota bacterium]
MSERAFLDVDTQVDFVEPGGALYAQGAEAIKPNLARLVEHARARGIPLVSSVDAHAPGDDEFSQFPPHCLRGTPGQGKVPESSSAAMVFVPSAPGASLPDPTACHAVLEKQQFSLFTNPNAERLLRATGAETFVVFGVVTEVCVRQAALGLLERGLGVELVEDAIWPIDRARGAETLRELEARGARLVTTTEVLAASSVSA